VPSLTPEVTDREGSGARVGERSCSHRMRVVGRVHGSRERRMDCDQPLRAVCRDCDHSDQWRCDSYGCEPCGEAKRIRLARLVDNGSAIHLANGMIGYFLTLTAPGHSTHRRWYQGRRPTSRPACDCHEHGLSDGMWNAQESACWNRLRTSLARDRDVIFVGAVETQKRGMLHRHVMLFTDDLLTHEEVQRLALAAGYGCVLDLEPVRSSAKAARYISKYVTKASGDRAVIPWERLDLASGELTGRRATYRLWSSSRRWGVTMRMMLAAQSAQARARSMYLRELTHELTQEGTAAALGLARDSGGDLSPP
jgi:hypothetical protein